MGGSSKSTSSQSSSTTNIDRRIGVIESGSIVASDRANINIDTIDGELIESVYSDTADLVGKVVDDGFQFGRDSLESNKAWQEFAMTFLDQGGALLEKNNDALARIAEAEKNEGLLGEQLVKVGIPALTVVLLASTMFKK